LWKAGSSAEQLAVSLACQKADNLDAQLVASTAFWWAAKKADWTVGDSAARSGYPSAAPKDALWAASLVVASVVY
jgi:hypothetical protein